MNRTVPAIGRPETSPKLSSNHEPILVVEANADLAQQLVEQLAADGYPAELACTANQARLSAAQRPPRLIVLGDLDRSRGSLDLLEDIRGGQPQDGHGQRTSPWPQSLPVIILSSRSTQLDLLRAFEAGTDDYLSRPARYLELRARLRALLRRSGNSQEEGALSIGSLKIDPAAHTASLRGERLELRPLEYELLLHLAADPRRVFRKYELLKAVWGYRADGSTRTVDTHASRLRRKLSTAGERWVINEWGVGYRLI